LARAVEAVVFDGDGVGEDGGEKAAWRWTTVLERLSMAQASPARGAKLA